MADNQEVDYLDIKNLLIDFIKINENDENRSLNRKIVFWYDYKKEYTSIINKIKEEMDDDSNEIILFNNNGIYIRYHIEIEEPNKNYVIYISGERKGDRQNDLLDLDSSSGNELYFNPDTTTKYLIELGLTDENRNTVIENKKFFQNQLRRAKFKEFDASKNNSTINYIIVSVLLGIKSISEDEILKNIVKEYLSSDKSKMKQLKSFANEEFVFNLFNKNFGTKIKDYEEFDILINNLLLTYFLLELKDSSKLDRYGDCIVPQKTNAQIFINNIINDKTTSNLFEYISEKVFKEYGIEEIFSVETALDYENSDAFAIIDINIIKMILNRLTSGVFNYEEIKNIVINRQSKYWYSKFSNDYNTILYAIDYLKEEKLCIEKIKSLGIEELVKLYSEELYKVDFNYRKTLYYFNRLKDNDDFKELIDIIENHYTNNFMFELSVKWDDALEKMPKYDSNKIIMQNNFFRKFIHPEISTGKNGRVIVIISDAFRYELAKELNYKLCKIAKNSEIKYMLGLVPSYTKLGKAVLLPNKKVSMIENSDDVLIDGKKSSSTADREKILQEECGDSLAIQYENLVRNYKKPDWKPLFKGKKVVYIYHDVVDKMGENDADNVFNACEDAIEQLYQLVESLHKTFSGVNVFITADHGFFYRRGEVKQINKVQKIQNADKNKTRYSYSKEKSKDDSVISFKLDYIFDNYDGYVEIPTGHNIFSKQGSPDKYFHGGDLPQELIIPLIDFKSARGSIESSKVGLVYSGMSYKITNAITYLNFTQNTSVDENNQECSYIVYFEDSERNKISNEVKILANRTEADYNERIFKEKFVFKSMEYSLSNAYYLVIKEEGKPNEVSRLKFDIDIAFSNHFDF